jgi:benzoyl-CoA reductase/2-hydroxyglutaryl-CoA dehydratase subunit BcrC/BadD/HgdB
MDGELVIADRRATIERWCAKGGRFAAVLPIHYPRELLRAHGLLPVEVWGPAGIDTSEAAAHLQAYTCPIVHHGLSFLLGGGAREAAAVVVPHACDSLQGLGSVLLDFFGGRAPPVLPLYIPRGADQSCVEFLGRELRALSARLATLLGQGAIGETELRAAIEREEKADETLARLHRRRASTGLTDLELYRLVRAREYLPAEDWTDLAEPVLGNGADQARGGVRLILSGIVPEPMEGLFETLREAGAVVVADDFACCGRRLYPKGTVEEPYERMAERILRGPPDPTRGSPIRARASRLIGLAGQSEAQGVVFYGMKFCEPELFDIPQLRRALEEAGVPSIAVEVDLGRDLPRQLVTRLEAFVEMVGRPA